MCRKLAELKQIPMEQQKLYQAGRFSQEGGSRQWESNNKWVNQMVCLYLLLNEMIGARKNYEYFFLV